MLPDSPRGELLRLMTGLTEELLNDDEQAALATILERFQCPDVLPRVYGDALAVAVATRPAIAGAAG